MRTTDKPREPARKPRRVDEAPPRANDETTPTTPPSDGRGASRADESPESATPSSHRPGGRGDATP